jgi:hypothetical protein
VDDEGVDSETSRSTRAPAVGAGGDRHARDVERLRRDVEGALKRALDPADVLPMLHRLVRSAPADSDESVFAHRQLAELIAPRHPWRAALYARRVVALRPADDRGWAILAFAQTLLENYRFAASAYARALTCSPKNPWYAHNLGHLLDVALDRPNEALPWLASAFAAARDHVEVATSYAHALARAGDLTLAKRILTRAMRATGAGPTREQAALWRWFERGAPGPKRDGRDGAAAAAAHGGPNSGPSSEEHRRRGFVPSLVSVELPELVESQPPPPARSRTRNRAFDDVTSADGGLGHPRAHQRSQRNERVGDVEEILSRHVAHLPFDAGQRARARAFSREIVTLALLNGSKPDVLAAAVAYAIVAHDDIPLTQAEVAATFRVPVSALRARYHQLRTALGRRTVDHAGLGLSASAAPASHATPSPSSPSCPPSPLRASRSSRAPRSSSSATPGSRKVKK